MQGRSRRRPTLAFLIDHLFDGFEEAVWTSIVSAARDEDVNLLCFLGDSLPSKTVADHPNELASARWGSNLVYELIHPENVDGIIGLSGSVGSLVDDEDLERFYARYAPIPILSLGRLLSSTPSLVVDNQGAMRQLMEHLIAHHGRRRIAFIRGPVTNEDAELRYQAYQESLAFHDLPFHPEYVFQGDFERAAGIHAIRAFLDERSIRPDAVVGANDYMALYAMGELTRRGIDVPLEVAVAGFDDIVDASSSIPSLTTVRQPFEEMGRAAVRRILALLRGEPVPPIETLPAQLVIRRSCGCISTLARRPSPGGLARAPGPVSPQELAETLERAAPELSTRIGEPGWARELADAFLRSAEAPGDFLEALERLLVRGRTCGVDPMRFHDVLHAALRSACERGAGMDTQMVLLAESSARLIGTMAVQALTAQHIREEEEMSILRLIFRPLRLSEDNLYENLLTKLPTLGIRSFFLGRFQDIGGRRAEIRAQYDIGNLQLTLEPGPFSSDRLLPGGFRPAVRHAHAVLPLHYIDERIGFALCEISANGLGIYETLSTQISMVIKVALLLGEVRHQASDLEVKVEERTRELREAQRKLLETAHRAGMAEVAVGVLHNVGNLLNSVSVCAEQLSGHASSPHADGLRNAVQLIASQQADLAGFFGGDARAALLPDYLEKLSAELVRDQTRSREEAKLLLEKVGVIRDTIGALQDLARDGHHAVLRDHVDLPGVLDVVLEIQAPLLLRYGVALRKELSSAVPVLVTERPKLIHVLINLVKNAVESMRMTPDGTRSIAVEAGLDSSGRVRIAVSDTGEGIAPENLDRIFSYGFTTKSDGHGFGLHTSALYASQMGGSLTVASEGSGRGATFTLSIPLEPPAA